MPTVPLCPLFLCSYCSSVPTVPLCPLFLCAHRSSVPTVPLCPLFLYCYCSSVPTVPLCLLFLCVYCSSVPSVPLCLLFFLVKQVLVFLLIEMANFYCASSFLNHLVLTRGKRLFCSWIYTFANVFAFLPHKRTKGEPKRTF